MISVEFCISLIMTLTLCFAVILILLNGHGSFSCNFNNKIKAISCREIQYLSEMIHRFEHRKIK